jgi:hypothetical protein
MVGFMRAALTSMPRVAQQIADMPLGAMAVQALETADGPVVVGLEIGRAAVDRAGVFIDPGAGDVVLAIAQRHLVEAAFAQCDEHAFSSGRGIQTGSPSSGR